jgi:Holliday junction resolvase
MRRAAKTDRNQSQMVGELRQMGFSVLLLHRVGQGCPDLLVGRGGRLLLVEVKDKGGKLTPDEKEFFDGWNEYAIVARSSEDVLAAFEAA